MRMDLESRKASIIDTTMKVASEVGLDVVTVNQVAKRAGISEALIFKYFFSKEQLLKECYFTVAQQFADFVNQFDTLEDCEPKEAEAFIHDFWEKCFNFFVELDYRMLFFLKYRETKYFYEVEEEGRLFFRERLQKFIGFFRKLDAMFRMDWEETGRLSRLYGIGMTSIFIRRIIDKRLENTQEIRDMIWRLQWKGLSGGIQTD